MGRKVCRRTNNHTPPNLKLLCNLSARFLLQLYSAEPLTHGDRLIHKPLPCGDHEDGFYLQVGAL